MLDAVAPLARAGDLGPNEDSPLVGTWQVAFLGEIEPRAARPGMLPRRVRRVGPRIVPAVKSPRWPPLSHERSPARLLVIDYRSAEGRPDRFRVLAAELVNLKVDLITTRGTPAALAAKSATRTIPVVMAAMLVLIPHSSTTDWRRA